MKRINTDDIIRDKIGGLEEAGNVPADMATAWQKLELRMEQAGPLPQQQKKVMLPWFKISVAAALLLLLASTAVSLLRPSGKEAQLAGIRKLNIALQNPAAIAAALPATEPVKQSGTVSAHTKDKPATLPAAPSATVAPITTITPSSPIVNTPETIPVAATAPVTTNTNPPSHNKVQQVLKRELEVAFVDDLFAAPVQTQPVPAKSSFVKIGDYQQAQPAHNNNDPEDMDPRLLARGKEMHTSHSITIKF